MRRFLIHYDPGEGWTLIDDCAPPQCLPDREACLAEASRRGATFRDIAYTTEARIERNRKKGNTHAEGQA